MRKIKRGIILLKISYEIGDILTNDHNAVASLMKIQASQL